jgi:very-short-patch-repair endonuclease
MPRQNPELTRFAREMRAEPTRAEAILWLSLRGKSLGVRFRRQVPIGPYIADFACLSHRLIVEIDGLTHDEPGQYEYDQRRDRWFGSQGG